eukprot:m51a1_g9863 hypothetical protein (90) ;mRNA; f:32196-32524
MGFAKLDLDTFDTMNLIPINCVSIPKKFNDLKDFVFTVTRPPNIYALRQLFDKIVSYKDLDHKPEYFIEVTKLWEKFDELTKLFFPNRG